MAEKLSSSDDEIANLLKLSTNSLKALRSNPVKLRSAVSSLANERCRVQQSGSEWSIRKFSYNMVESLETTMQFIQHRENIKNANTNVHPSVHLSKNPPNDEKNDQEQESENDSLFDVSEIEDNGSDDLSETKGFVTASDSGDTGDLEILLDDHHASASPNEETGDDIEDNTIIRKTRKQARNFPCDVCGKKFTSQSNLNIHRRIHSGDINVRRTFECDKCEKRFTTPSNLETHKKKHLPNGEPKAKCDICGKLMQRHSLRYHKRTHLDGTDPKQAEEKRPHKCEICGKCLVTAYWLKKHILNHKYDDNPEHAKIHECNDCGRKFALLGNFSRHKRLHLPNGEPKVECNICGKAMLSCSIPYHMRTHLDEKDPNQADEKRPYKCEICGKGLTSLHSLKKHTLNHSYDNNPDQAKVHECSVCHRKFSLLSNLTRHKRSHETSEVLKKPYKCDICEKRFSDSCTLTKHKRMHGSETERRPYSCEICGNTFTNKDNLDGHKIRHGIFAPNKTYHKCDVCKKYFPNSTVLRRHKRKHIDENDPEQAILKRPYECELCETKFTDSGSLKAHMRIHSDSIDVRRTYKCEVCGKGYVDSRGLDRHMKSHGTMAAKRIGKNKNAETSTNESEEKRGNNEETDAEYTCGAWPTDSGESEI